MIKKIKLTILTFIVIILSFFIIKFTLNEINIMLYHKSINSDKLIKSLYILNLNEPYIVYYNNGNINFSQKKYDKAIENYELSLNNNPPDKRVCDIRVNLSLSMIYNITSTDKETVLNELKKARNYLYENDCAHENDDKGKSKKAKELEEEIKELEQKVKDGEESNNNSNQQNNNSNSNTQNYDNIEEQLKEQQKKNNATRRNENEKTENMGDYEYYRGKRW